MNVTATECSNQQQQKHFVSLRLGANTWHRHISCIFFSRYTSQYVFEILTKYCDVTCFIGFRAHHQVAMHIGIFEMPVRHAVSNDLCMDFECVLIVNFDCFAFGVLTGSINPTTKTIATHDTISAWFCITNSWLKNGGFLFDGFLAIPGFIAITIYFLFYVFLWLDRYLCDFWFGFCLFGLFWRWVKWKEEQKIKIKNN